MSYSQMNWAVACVRRLIATPPPAQGTGPVHNTKQHLHVVRMRRLGGMGKGGVLVQKPGYSLGGRQCAGIGPIGGLPKRRQFVPGGVERAGIGIFNPPGRDDVFVGRRQRRPTKQTRATIVSNPVRGDGEVVGLAGQCGVSIQVWDATIVHSRSRSCCPSATPVVVGPIRHSNPLANAVKSMIGPLCVLTPLSDILFRINRTLGSWLL